MQGTTLVIIFFVIVVFLTPIIRRYLKGRKQYIFMRYMDSGDYKALEKSLDSFSSKALFPRYVLESIRLRSYLLQNEKRKIDEQYEVVIESAMGKKQKKEIITNAFEHYVFQADEAKSRSLLKQVKEFEDEDLSTRCQMLYDIFIDKKADHIKILEQNLDKLEGSEKMLSAYLLSCQYSNIGNKKKADYYGKMSKDFFE